MFKIGEFSRLSNTSVRMLRHFDKLALLTPHLVDPESDYRYYQASQLATVNKIKQLQELGFSLSLIKELVTNPQKEQISHSLDLRQQELLAELAQLERQQQLVASAKSILTQQSTLSDYHVLKKTIPERLVMSVKQQIPTYADEYQLWEILAAEAQSQNVKQTSPPLALTLYHGEEYQEHQIEAEVQSSVVGSYHDSQVATFKTIPATLVATVTFSGSYEQLPLVAEAVASWMEINQYQLAGPMFNIFHVSPAHSQQIDEWVTEACYQIKPRKVASHGSTTNQSSPLNG